jgi:hypothetical protein
MHKLIALAAAALVTALPAPAYPCLNGVLLVEDEQIRDLERAERLLVAGKHDAALREVDGYGHLDELEGRQAQAFRRRIRLVIATAHMRKLARHQPIDVHRLANVTRVLRSLQSDDGQTPPLYRARLAEALALTPGAMAEAKTLIEKLERGDLIPEAEAWVTVAKVRTYMHDVDGMSRALARCEKMAGKRKAVCHGDDFAS